MQVLRVFAVLMFVGILSGCASGPRFQDVASSMSAPQPDKGRIFFYRSSSMFGAAIQPSVLLNGVKVGDSVPGGFFYVDQSPGSMLVTTSTEVERKLSFVLEAGQTRYVRTVIGFGLIAGRVYPELVDNATGRTEIQEMSYTAGGEKK